MRKRGRVDRNHGELVSALLRCGYLVQSLATIGGGCPDVLTYRRDRGLELLEFKATARAPLTPAQRTFTQLGWPVRIVRSLDEVLR